MEACLSFLVAEEFSLCVPATPCSRTSTSRLTTLLEGRRNLYGHKGHCREDSALSGTSKAAWRSQDLVNLSLRTLYLKCP